MRRNTGRIWIEEDKKKKKSINKRNGKRRWHLKEDVDSLIGIRMILENERIREGKRELQNKRMRE